MNAEQEGAGDGLRAHAGPKAFYIVFHAVIFNSQNMNSHTTFIGIPTTLHLPIQHLMKIRKLVLAGAGVKTAIETAA